jgi:hypothetical protein
MPGRRPKPTALHKLQGTWHSGNISSAGDRVAVSGEPRNDQTQVRIG